MTSRFNSFDTEKQKISISEFANSVISSYPIRVRTLECVNFEYNASFKVSTENGEIFALRININSRRSKANLAAEVQFVQHLHTHSEILAPVPVALISGDFYGSSFHHDSNRELNFVLYEWLEGDVLGDQPSPAQVRALGEIMAKMHIATRDLEFAGEAMLENLRDPLWNQSNNLTGPDSKLTRADQVKVNSVLQQLDSYLAELYSSNSPQPIHADLHGWNVLSSERALSVLDFDDCAIGFPLQDIATTLYYLDTKEQDREFLEGYSSIGELPKYTEHEISLLLLQRRLVLLNYLMETSTPEHQALLPKYLEDSLKRIDSFFNVQNSLNM